jgi:hypothetical protein
MDAEPTHVRCQYVVLHQGLTTDGQHVMGRDVARCRDTAIQTIIKKIGEDKESAACQDQGRAFDIALLRRWCPKERYSISLPYCTSFEYPLL